MWIFTLALAAPLDDDAIDALIERDQLARDPWEESCCGGGGIARSEVRWAELTGEAPEELVLTMQEYVGEGIAADHHYVYDVSGATPVSMGKVDQSGDANYPDVTLEDLDRDGIVELLAIGGYGGDSPSTLQVYRVVDGALAQVGDTANPGQVYLPFDVDQDAKLELVALAAYDDSVTFEVLDRLARPTQAAPISTWLPRLFETVLAAPDVDRPRDTLRMLRQAMEERGLGPDDPEAAFESVLDRIAGPSGAFPWVEATWWAGTPEQRERAARLLAHPDSAQDAAMLLLSTPGDRVPPVAWIHDRFRDTAEGRGRRPHDSLLLQLDPKERSQLCNHVQQLLLADGPEKAMDAIAHALADPLWCVDASTALLAAETPRPAVRGAIEAIYESALDDDAEAAVYARRDDIAPLLIDRLNGDDEELAAVAARTLRHVGSHGDVLRKALLATESSSVRWGTLVSIAELDEPGPAAVFLEVLGREGRHGVRNRLHGQLARMPDPEDVVRGLALVRDHGDYDAYHWRAVYRPESLSEAHRAVYRADAGRRLADPEPWTRQAAAQVLGSLGPGAHGETLRALADNDPESYVRSAAAEALAP